MLIPLGTIVRDKVTGFTGVAENRATFLYGCDRYCVQPQVGEDGKIPEAAMIDAPQLEIVEGVELAMKAAGTPPELVQLGQVVTDPIREVKGTVTGRAVYLNGCSRVHVEPKYSAKTKELTGFWVDEKQVEPTKTFSGKTVVTREPEEKTEKSPGGPAPANSKY